MSYMSIEGKLGWAQLWCCSKHHQWPIDGASAGGSVSHVLANYRTEANGASAVWTIIVMLVREEDVAD